MFSETVPDFIKLHQRSKGVKTRTFGFFPKRDTVASHGGDKHSEF